MNRHGPIPSESSEPIAPDASAGPGQPASVGPLSTEHRAQIEQAQKRLRKIRFASKVASFNAWSFAILAVFSLLFVYFSLYSLVAVAILGGLAWNEFRGRNQLRRLDRRGPSTLGFNQLLCCAVIALYCALKLYTTMTGPGLYEQAIERTPELATTLEPIKDLIKLATILAYILILVLGVGMQGATAWYYFSRKRWLDTYLQQTPEWVTDLLRTKASA